MSMDLYTSVKGLVVADKKYKSMLNIYNACVEEDITPPEIVMEYFSVDSTFYKPSGYGIEVDIKAAIETDGDINTEEGIYREIDLKKLPSNVTKIRIFNRYC